VIIGLSLVFGMLTYELTYPIKTAESRSRTFLFDWPRGTQNVTDVGLKIFLNFTIVGDELVTVATINDSRPYPTGALCFAFDANNNSRIDFDDAPPAHNGTWLLYPNNMSQIAMTQDWENGVIESMIIPKNRGFHYCIYNGTDYTYTITFPLKEFPNDIVQFIYLTDKGSVVIRFHFGLI